MAVMLFVAIATLFQIGRFAQNDVIVDLSGDAGDIASFCAAWDHPELFARDGLLSDPGNFRFYATVHIPLVRSLYRVYGNYGTAFLSMIGIHVFLHLFGFWILGRVCTRSRLWALLFAGLFLVSIWLSWGTFWGIWPDPLPRVGFSALLGFLWAMAVWVRNRPSSWAWVLASAGLLMYVHPVSAPTIAISMLVGFFTLSIYRRHLTWRRLGWLIICGLIFVAVAGPFVINYMSNHAHGVLPNADLARTAMEDRLTRGFMVDHIEVIGEFLLSGIWPRGFLLCGVLGLGLFLRFAPAERRGLLAMIGGWAAGVVICSVGLFLIDHAIAKATGGLPVQISLIRGLRFLVPLCFLLLLLGLHATVQAAPMTWRRIACGTVASVAVIGLMFALWSVAKRGTAKLVPAGWHIVLGQLGLAAPVEKSPPYLQEAIMALREHTPEGATILPVGLSPMVVRYGALRAVSFCRKDGGVLGYTNTEALLVWYEREKVMGVIRKMPRGREKLDDCLQFAQRVGADYVFFRRQTVYRGDMTDQDNFLWANRSYAIVRIEP